MWGSDFPVSDISTQPTLVGLESLRALKSAADLIGLNNPDIKIFFYHNAMRLTDQLRPSGM